MPTDRQQHIVQYSGGIGSWATAMRVAQRHGVKDLTLLAADCRAERPDLWRFVRQSGEYLGVEPVIVADGRDPWEVFLDERFLGTRVWHRARSTSSRSRAGNGSRPTLSLTRSARCSTSGSTTPSAGGSPAPAAAGPRGGWSSRRARSRT